MAFLTEVTGGDGVIALPIWAFEETTGKCGEYEELEKHLMEATKKFDQVLGSSDDSLVQNVPEMYLEPIRYTIVL